MCDTGPGQHQDIVLNVDDPHGDSATIEFDVLANFPYDVEAEIENKGDALVQQTYEFGPALTGPKVPQPGLTERWRYKIEIAADDSAAELEYLEAGDYAAEITFSVVSTGN